MSASFHHSASALFMTLLVFVSMLFSRERCQKVLCNILPAWSSCYSGMSLIRWYWDASSSYVNERAQTKQTCLSFRFSPAVRDRLYDSQVAWARLVMIIPYWLVMIAYDAYLHKVISYVMIEHTYDGRRAEEPTSRRTASALEVSMIITVNW